MFLAGASSSIGRGLRLLSLIVVKLLAFEHSVDAAFVFALLNGLTLVVGFFASTDTDNELGIALFGDEESQRNDSKAYIIVDLLELIDFAFGEQEFAVTTRVVVIVGAVEVFSDVHTFYPHLRIFDDAVGVGQARLTLSDRLNLGACQHETGCVGIRDFVVKRGSTVFDINLTLFHFLSI